ncbi:AmmeMemoRadiSam system protein A [Candidatus Contubernalis alkaliaceticus]|uniref:AmmeMemoRadiSam system protein A n=1 Tax=Candidatus Contubernalis alkaliaceticus TaxID=338645 RepID=UPI001F4BFDC9|nr:AmmeMemoRadiSam system protein A [Candidatus Contubernalis alkalaceticus]UNC90975.1 AmmeMemoRadiSam system protein A [Candidatus Contubernalis alkalaceticus]
MNNIVMVGITPHPPLIIPEVGGLEAEKVQNTVKSLQELAAQVKISKPETVVIITPHGPVFRDAVAVTGEDELTGSMEQFGAPQVIIQVPNDLEMVKYIIEEAAKEQVLGIEMDKQQAKKYDLSLELDHGALVPMYFLKKQLVKASFVHITIGFLSYPELYSFGKAIQMAAHRADRKIAVLASGDLSHCLIPGAPAQYHPAGQAFDQKLKKLLEEYRVEEIISMDDNLVKNAAECGLRPIIMALGSLDGCKVESHIISYEGPFGVGYLVGILKAGQFRKENEAGDRYYRLEQEKLKVVHDCESIYVKLARDTLEKAVQKGEKPQAPSPLPEELKDKAGVFVSIKKQGQLRGCIGTIEPTRKNIAEEIQQNALSAGLSDPRFPPVSPEELPYLVISVDILMPPEPVTGQDELDPQKYGVIVKSGSKKGLLLPQLEGVNTVDEQLAIAREKAGITSREQVELYRFEVKRHY